MCACVWGAQSGYVIERICVEFSGGGGGLCVYAGGERAQVQCLIVRNKKTLTPEFLKID